jgi:hypothetical protein
MELLKRFKQGEVDAFETLFRQFQAEVFGWIAQIVQDPGIAEDLTIETFWRIHKARERFLMIVIMGVSVLILKRAYRIERLRLKIIDLTIRRPSTSWSPA